MNEQGETATCLPALAQWRADNFHAQLFYPKAKGNRYVRNIGSLHIYQNTRRRIPGDTDHFLNTKQCTYSKQ